MSYLKCQKLTYAYSENNARVVATGTSSIVKTVYNPQKKRGEQRVIELLGKILWIDDDDPHHHGIFQSPTRGLCEYDVLTDEFSEVAVDDPRIAHIKERYSPNLHTAFGDSYLFLKYLSRIGFLDILRESFPDEKYYEKLLVHLIHDVNVNGAHTSCDDYMRDCAASYIFDEIHPTELRSDTSYFSYMGDDKAKISFFRSYIKAMKQIHPEFGVATYVDSTPIPYDGIGNPLAALCSHGVGSTCTQVRMVMVLDQITNLPVWFTLIPGNVLDMSTIINVKEDVSASLGINIDSFILDAGYASDALFKEINVSNIKNKDADGKISNRSVIIRMPAKNGYPFYELYNECKDHFGIQRFNFTADNHSYYGERRLRTIRGYDEYCYVFYDMTGQDKLFRQWIKEHEDEYLKMSEEDKEIKRHKFGFFILISNLSMTPKEMLKEYFKRISVEQVFRTTKEYLNILPIAKWNKTTMTGKILHDVICLIAYTHYKLVLSGTVYSASNLISEIKSLDCFKNGDMLTINTPKKQTKRFYEIYNVAIPGHLLISDYRDEIVFGIKPTEEINTSKRKKAGRPKGSRDTVPRKKKAASDTI